MPPGLFPGILQGAGGPGSSISLPTTATGETGSIRFGNFNFAPGKAALPTWAWIAIAVAAAAAGAFYMKGRAR